MRKFLRVLIVCIIMGVLITGFMSYAYDVSMTSMNNGSGFWNKQ